MKQEMTEDASSETTQVKPKMANDYSLDINALSLKNREKLIRTFLPDIERAQARLGYVHKVTPFNYNQEHFKTVEVRRRPAVYTRPLYDSKVLMKLGLKAANEMEPRPMWAIKPLMQSEKSVVNPSEEYTVFTRFYPWRYREEEKDNYQYKNVGRISATMSDRTLPTFQMRGGRTGSVRIRNVRTS